MPIRPASFINTETGEVTPGMTPVQCIEAYLDDHAHVANDQMGRGWVAARVLRAELTATRAMLAEREAEAGRLRTIERAAREVVRAQDAYGLIGTMTWRIYAEVVDAERKRNEAIKDLRAALEVKPTDDATQAQIDALAEVGRLQRDNARLHNAGLTLLGIVSELHAELFPASAHRAELAEARAALEVKQP